jgi:hypothetical protein
MKFKFLKAVTTASIMATCTFAGVANATVITELSERDWINAGDKAITYDSSTGLEWLDLTQTLGNSILATEQESFYGEFRWATHLEIENIFDAVLNGTGHRSSNSAVVKSRASVFVSMLGQTQGWEVAQGVSRGSVSSTGQYGLGYVYNSSSSANVADPSSNCCWNDSTGHQSVGSWLVKEASGAAPASTVNEPATLAIFALGMIGLASRRFKKQS